MRPRHLITRPLLALLRRNGYDIVARSALHQMAAGLPSDFGEQDRADWEAAAAYTMVPPERIYTLARAIEHIVARSVPGAVVECGTWKGGCALTAARTLRRLGDTTRELWLYDLFGGDWPRPTDFDVHPGGRALDYFESGQGNPPEMMYTLGEVQTAVHSSGYPRERIRWIAGPVEQTVPAQAPERIALLRLDTDFYESTRHELQHLYPRLSPGGILIIDDYGEWQGSRRAVDEFFAGRSDAPALIRVDQSCRMGAKPGP